MAPACPILKAKAWSPGKTLLWAGLVLGLSFLCYLPLLLRQKGLFVPEPVLWARYGFVGVPLGVSWAFALFQRRRWPLSLFTAPIKPRALLFCLIPAGMGLAVSGGYALWGGRPELFAQSYPSAQALLMGCAYLYATALVEELAWRGFLLTELLTVMRAPAALALSGLLWALWHIPMWSIRNGLGLGEVLLYLLWSFLLSLIFGAYFLRWGSAPATALAHMLFNACFLAPIEYNLIGGALILLGIAARKGTAGRR